LEDYFKGDIRWVFHLTSGQGALVRAAWRWPPFDFEIAAQAAQAPIQLPIRKNKVIPPDGDTAATGEGKLDEAAMKGKDRRYVYSTVTAEIPSADADRGALHHGDGVRHHRRGTTTGASGDGEADSILLASRASVPLLMVYGRRSALSRALHTGAQVLFCSALTLSS
jgi:hypothetical protein